MTIGECMDRLYPFTYGSFSYYPLTDSIAYEECDLPIGCRQLTMLPYMKMLGVDDYLDTSEYENLSVSVTASNVLQCTCPTLLSGHHAGCSYIVSK
jgi:hypothetical protein